MKQENVFTSSQVEEILKNEFKKFQKKWHGAITSSDTSTLSQYIEQVKYELNKTPINLA